MTSVELKSPTAPDSVTVTESNELESNDEEGLCGVIADCGTVNVEDDCACTLTTAKATAVASSDIFVNIVNIVKRVIVEHQISPPRPIRLLHRYMTESQTEKQVEFHRLRSAQSQVARLAGHLRSLFKVRRPSRR